MECDHVFRQTKTKCTNEASTSDPHGRQLCAECYKDWLKKRDDGKKREMVRKGKLSVVYFHRYEIEPLARLLHFLETNTGDIADIAKATQGSRSFFNKLRGKKNVGNGIDRLSDQSVEVFTQGRTADPSSDLIHADTPDIGGDGETGR